MPSIEPADAAEENNKAVALPFEGLRVPQPINAAPPLQARVISLVGVLVGGLLGALIGYGVTELLTGGNSILAALGALVGGVGCAVGVGIIVSLTLRAMNEWNVVKHPDDINSH